MKHHILAVFLFGLSTLAGVAESEGVQTRKVDAKEYSSGESDAQRDLKQGKVVYEIVGEPSMIDVELKKIAARDYGIEVKFHGCVRGPRVDYDQGYLDTVIAYLKKKYSFDPVMKVEKELRAKGAGAKAEDGAKPQTEVKPEVQLKPETAPR